MSATFGSVRVMMAAMRRTYRYREARAHVA